MDQPSRVEQARRRLRTTRLVVGAGSAVAFAALAVVARAAHPGRAHTARSTGPATAAATDNAQSGFFFGNGSIQSSRPDDGTTPQTQSRGS
jgi:hypothetical protein